MTKGMQHSKPNTKQIMILDITPSSSNVERICLKDLVKSLKQDIEQSVEQNIEQKEMPAMIARISMQTRPAIKQSWMCVGVTLAKSSSCKDERPRSSR